MIKDENIIIVASEFASFAHRGQKRKFTKESYICHPSRVAKEIQITGSPEEDVCIAWLHDTIEDCEVTYSLLVKIFGKTIAGGVLNLTNPSKMYPNLTRSKRKQLDIENIARQNANIKIIKMEDRIDNLKDMIYNPDMGFRKLYAEESTMLFDVIAKDIKNWSTHPNRIDFGYTLANQLWRYE